MSKISSHTEKKKEIRKIHKSYIGISLYNKLKKKITYGRHMTRFYLNFHITGIEKCTK